MKLVTHGVDSELPPPMSASEQLRQTAEGVLVVREVEAAAAALLADWRAGGKQAVRRQPCGDEECDYASCRLAVALSELELIAVVGS